MPEPRPYPLSRVPRFTRSDAARVRRAARERLLETLLAPAGEAGWSARLSGPPRLSLPASDSLPRPSLLLERADGARAWLELERAIAAALVDRTLGGEGLDAASPAPLDEFALGILVYAIARGLAEGAGWAIVGAFAYDAAPRQALGEASPLVGFPLRLRAGPTEGGATLWLGSLPSRPRPVARALPRWMSSLRVAARVIAGRATLPRAPWREVQRGDALMPDRLDLARVRVEGARADWSFDAHREGDEWRVERAPLWNARRGGAKRVGSADGEEPPPMTDDAMNELPLTLTLEVARFEITLSDLAALAPGELLSSGIPLDGAVVVRAGERAIARGELVDIDGETGVRILELLDR